MSTEGRDLAIQQGIAGAIANEASVWKQRYLDLFAEFSKGRERFHGGEVCAWMREHGMPEPHHHNVWAAVVGTAARRNGFVKEGYVEPDTEQSHIGRVVNWVKRSVPDDTAVL